MSAEPQAAVKPPLPPSWARSVRGPSAKPGLEGWSVGCDVHQSLLPPCRWKLPWKSGNGGFVGLFRSPADRLDMISSSLVEIRETAISTCPPFSPPTGDHPALDMVGRPRPRGQGERRDVVPVLQIGVKSLHGGFG
jgi:hypothetical protein